MKIQPRDLELMSGLLKYGLMSSEQISDLFFKNIHHTVPLRRLRILEKEKIILRLDALPHNQSAWSLGAEGARYLKAEAPGRFTNRNTTLHDVTVTGIRIALESIGLCQNFTTEMEMKKRFKYNARDQQKEFLQVPDGLFMAQMNGKDSEQVVALEVELQPKSHARYKRIVSQYLSKDSIGYVWYVVKNVGIANVIFNEWRKLKRFENSPTFLFSFIEATVKNPCTLQLFSTETQNWIEIADAFHLPHLKENPPQTDASSLGSESVPRLGNSAA